MTEKQNIIIDVMIVEPTVAKFLSSKDVNGSELPDEFLKKNIIHSYGFKEYKEGDVVRITVSYDRETHLKRVLSISSLEQIEDTNEEEEMGYWLCGDIYATDKVMAVFITAHNMANSVGFCNVKLTGKSGYGKTTIPKFFAEETGRSFLRFNCAQVQNTEEWFGVRGAEKGSTKFELTDLGKAITEGNYVILLDELSRAEPTLSATLFPILDDERSIVIQDQHFKVGKNTIFCVSVNEGYEYSGTYQLDKALNGRIDLTLEIQGLPKTAEVQVIQKRTGIKKEDAEKIVHILDVMRKAKKINDVNLDLTTRTSIKIANAVSSGLDLRYAFELVIVENIDLHEKRGVVDFINTLLEKLPRFTFDENPFGMS